MSSGDLDTTFNSPDGYVLKTFTPEKNTNADKILIDSLGRFVITGVTIDINDVANLYLARYTTSGKLDKTFANVGYVITNFGTGFNTFSTSVQIDSLENIIVVGYAVDINNKKNLLIAKYKNNGELDTTFGNGNGYIIDNFITGDIYARNATLDSLDNILVTGFVSDVISVLFVIKYNKNGDLDTTFNSPDGYIIENSVSSKNSAGQSISVDSLNNIIVTGNAYDNNDNYNLILIKYTSSGNLDTTFNSPNGYVMTTFDTNKITIGNSLVIDNSDNIIVVGSNNLTNLLVAKYNSDGKLDTTFNNSIGYIISELEPCIVIDVNSVALDKLENIVITGTISPTETMIKLFLVRYTTSGELDTTFNNPNGYLTSIFLNGFTFGLDLCIDSFNNIIVVGFDILNGINNLLIAKYLGENKTTTTSTTTTTTTEPICLPAGTPIFTDQGTISIEMIQPNVNTINGNRIVAITKTITPEKYLVCFDKYCLGMNIPSQRTLMTPGHEVLYKGQLVQSKKFLGRLEGVYAIPYNGDVLYNVLQEKHGLMRVNNMILETLHPENKVAKQILGTV